MRVIVRRGGFGIVFGFQYFFFGVGRFLTVDFLDSYSGACQELPVGFLFIARFANQGSFYKDVIQSPSTDNTNSDYQASSSPIISYQTSQ